MKEGKVKIRVPDYGTFTFSLLCIGTPEVSLAVKQAWRGPFAGKRYMDIPLAALWKALDKLEADEA